MNTSLLSQSTKADAQLVFRSATELTARLRTGELSSVDLVEAHIARIKECNPAINAVIVLDAENALKKAREADSAIANHQCWGPLHGLPMTVRDALATTDIQTTFGDPSGTSYRLQTDAAIVQAVKNAGAIIIGKTNIPRDQSSAKVQ